MTPHTSYDGKPAQAWYNHHQSQQPSPNQNGSKPTVNAKKPSVRKPQDDTKVNGTTESAKQTVTKTIETLSSWQLWPKMDLKPGEEEGFLDVIYSEDISMNSTDNPDKKMTKVPGKVLPSSKVVENSNEIQEWEFVQKEMSDQKSNSSS